MSYLEMKLLNNCQAICIGKTFPGIWSSRTQILENKCHMLKKIACQITSNVKIRSHVHTGELVKMVANVKSSITVAPIFIINEGCFIYNGMRSNDSFNAQYTIRK